MNSLLLVRIRNLEIENESLKKELKELKEAAVALMHTNIYIAEKTNRPVSLAKKGETNDDRNRS